MKHNSVIHHFITSLNAILKSWFLFASLLNLPSLQLEAQVFQHSVLKIMAESPQSPGVKEKDSGTGFIICIDSFAYILTAKHVIENRYSRMGHTQITADFFGRPGHFPVEIFKRKQNRDIAVLELNAPPSYALAFDFSPCLSSPRLNDEVFVVGYPGGGKLEISEGYISKLDNERICVKGIKVDKGFSGAPLIHKESGKVLGMFVEMNPNSEEQCALSMPFIKSQIPDICNPCYPLPPCPCVFTETQIRHLNQAHLLLESHFCDKALNQFKILWDSLGNDCCLKIVYPNPPYQKDDKCSVKVKIFKKIFSGCYALYKH